MKMKMLTTEIDPFSPDVFWFVQVTQSNRYFTVGRVYPIIAVPFKSLLLSSLFQKKSMTGGD